MALHSKAVGLIWEDLSTALEGHRTQHSVNCSSIPYSYSYSDLT
jgi:hypothetical protein